MLPQLAAGRGVPPRLGASLLFLAPPTSKAHGLDLTISHGEVIQQCRGHQDPTPKLLLFGTRSQGARATAIACCLRHAVQPWGRASFSSLVSSRDTGVLRNPPLPQAWNARHPSGTPGTPLDGVCVPAGQLSLLPTASLFPHLHLQDWVRAC